MSKSSDYSPQLLCDILQWDISTWQQALFYWDSILPQNVDGCRAIDLGARDGGLSLWLAQKGYDVICSDINGPSELALVLHQRYGVDQKVDYRAIDATAMAFADDYFDVVVFKSMLGGIGFYSNFAAIEQALSEIQRVLKPGGVLLFAENLLGSGFHQFARQNFVPWGKDWYYPSLPELEQLLTGFAERHVYSYGFFSCIKKDFGPFVAIDKLICQKSVSANFYMAYGHAEV